MRRSLVVVSLTRMSSHMSSSESSLDIFPSGGGAVLTGAQTSSGVEVTLKACTQNNAAQKITSVWIRSRSYRLDKIVQQTSISVSLEGVIVTRVYFCEALFVRSGEGVELVHHPGRHDLVVLGGDEEGGRHNSTHLDLVVKLVVVEPSREVADAREVNHLLRNGGDGSERVFHDHTRQTSSRRLPGSEMDRNCSTYTTGPNNNCTPTDNACAEHIHIVALPSK